MELPESSTQRIRGPGPRLLFLKSLFSSANSVSSSEAGERKDLFLTERAELAEKQLFMLILSLYLRNGERFFSVNSVISSEAGER